MPTDWSAVVMDIQGRPLDTVPARAVAVEKGALVFEWDGRTDTATTARPGVYRVRVESPTLNLRTERLLVLRGGSRRRRPGAR